MQTLYDFIFIDQERVCSLYTQLFDGLHDAMEKAVSNVNGQSTTGQAGGDPIGYLNHSRAKEVGETRSDRFLPHDLILRDVLGKLHELNLISKSPNQPAVGDLVLLSGTLTLLDTSILNTFIDFLPKFLEEPNQSDYKNFPPKERTRMVKEQKKNIEKGTAICSMVTSMMPKIIQFSLSDKNITAWGTIEQSHMRVDVAHILIQQGAKLAGNWHILAIVDGISSEANKDISKELPQPFDAVSDFLAGLRDMFKKPEGDLLVTPLLLFRKLNAQ